MVAIRPFTVAIPEAELVDLKERLSRTRWPDRETIEGWGQGVPLAEAKRIVDYWRTNYDWRRCEAMLNRRPQFTTEIDGISIYFIHVRSPHSDAQPLLLTHGWPGSVLEFLKVIDGLTDPQAHGGSAGQAFDVVIPALPGYGFSGKPAQSGWTVERIADAWAVLMQRLGYDCFAAQGGDWGSPITIALAAQHPQLVSAIHVNLVLAIPTGIMYPTPEEQAEFDAIADHRRWNTGYSAQQATRPQTLGYGLADSPAEQAMWIYDKYRFWMDCNGDPETVMSLDDLLDNISIYWLTNSGTSSARLYWESFTKLSNSQLSLPVGFSRFPGEMTRPLRHWVEAVFPNLVYWSDAPRGGHFAAWEQPGLFVLELREWAAAVRASAPG